MNFNNLVNSIPFFEKNKHKDEFSKINEETSDFFDENLDLKTDIEISQELYNKVGNLMVEIRGYVKGANIYKSSDDFNNMNNIYEKLRDIQKRYLDLKYPNEDIAGAEKTEERQDYIDAMKRGENINNTILSTRKKIGKLTGGLVLAASLIYGGVVGLSSDKKTNFSNENNITKNNKNISDKNTSNEKNIIKHIIKTQEKPKDNNSTENIKLSTDSNNLLSSIFTENTEKAKVTKETISINKELINNFFNKQENEFKVSLKNVFTKEEIKKLSEKSYSDKRDFIAKEIFGDDAKNFSDYDKKLIANSLIKKFFPNAKDYDYVIGKPTIDKIKEYLGYNENKEAIEFDFNKFIQKNTKVFNNGKINKNINEEDIINSFGKKTKIKTEEYLNNILSKLKNNKDKTIIKDLIRMLNNEKVPDGF